MNIIDKQIIQHKLNIITVLQEAYTLLLNDGDITKFCDDNDLNVNVLLDLLATDWSMALTNSPNEEILQIKLNSPIEELNLCTRTYNALKRANIHIVSQLLGLSLNDLNQIKSLGHKGINELILQMRRYGMTNWLKENSDQ